MLKAVTVTHLGPLEESPVSIQAPGDARSLSYGRAVCTYSFDTIRSTTLTRETVTATLYLLHPSEISQRSANYFSYGVRSIGVPCEDSTSWRGARRRSGQFQQRTALRDTISAREVNGLHDSGVGRRNRVFHLHGLDHHEDIAGGHCLASCDRY